MLFVCSFLTLFPQEFYFMISLGLTWVLQSYVQRLWRVFLLNCWTFRLAMIGRFCLRQVLHEGIIVPYIACFFIRMWFYRLMGKVIRKHQNTSQSQQNTLELSLHPKMPTPQSRQLEKHEKTMFFLTPYHLNKEMALTRSFSLSENHHPGTSGRVQSDQLLEFVVFSYRRKGRKWWF